MELESDCFVFGECAHLVLLNSGTGIAGESYPSGSRHCGTGNVGESYLSDIPVHCGMGTAGESNVSDLLHGLVGLIYRQVRLVLTAFHVVHAMKLNQHLLGDPN